MSHQLQTTSIFQTQIFAPTSQEAASTEISISKLVQSTTHISKMCKTEIFKSHTCPHKWMTIVAPCSKGASFKNKYHRYTSARGMLAMGAIAAPANTCPNCDKKGDYDANMTRFILKGPWEAGNMGNGYDMTDGRGNVIQPRYGYQYGNGHGTGGCMPPGARHTSCGVSRTSIPQQPYYGQPGCCAVM